MRPEMNAVRDTSESNILQAVSHNVEESKAEKQLQKEEWVEVSDISDVSENDKEDMNILENNQ